MSLKNISWKKFLLNDYFDIMPGKYYYSNEYEQGTTPYISATSINNGVSEYISIAPDFPGNCITTEKIKCKAFYQKDPFCATSDINVFVPKFKHFNEKIGLFICTIINFDQNYRWSYGRQCRVRDSRKIEVYLPSSKNNKPDWFSMEQTVSNLRFKKITTNNKSSNFPNLTLKIWKEFYLHEVFKTTIGNGIDFGETSAIKPEYHYISRNSNNNGIIGVIDKIDGQTPFPSGAITVALGGSYLGSSFIQKKAFYTAQNVGVLIEKEPLSDATKLFISTLIRNECKIKYQAFGRELNSHFRKDFTIKLPVKCEGKEPIIDSTNKYSERGYIPDWQFMHNYITSLPYGDRV
ncbi:restriction endonuclease subunit S [Enterococcus faecalis]|uniref:restriction endonuclease subunit S n=1 Tax=Enterococcus faecalis TaxID=1351 RepID=UPI0019264203|nr:restriction endonuclease subunit S [Enterococcus faecalis]MDN3139578.1 restriction endonuclease subunit S [Enterococcus faecalis]